MKIMIWFTFGFLVALSAARIIAIDDRSKITALQSQNDSLRAELVKSQHLHVTYLDDPLDTTTNYVVKDEPTHRNVSRYNYLRQVGELFVIVDSTGKAVDTLFGDHWTITIE